MNRRIYRWPVRKDRKQIEGQKDRKNGQNDNRITANKDRIIEGQKDNSLKGQKERRLDRWIEG